MTAVSDPDLPPPPPGATPPPPPPPNLTAPPGYVGYQPSPMSSVPLKRVGGLSKAASILVVLTGLAAIATIASTQAVADDAQAYLDDEISNSDFLTAITPYALLSFLQVFVLFASVVIVIVWMYRVASNHRALHRGTTWGPGWAIGGWFAPPFLFVIPFLVLREMWKASDPDVPVGGEWRGNPVSPLVTLWFVVYGPLQIVLQVFQFDETFAGLGASETTMAEQITANQTIPVLAALSQLVAAVLFAMVVRGVTSRHRRLTGEQPG